MLIKTHIAITVFFIFLFLPHVTSKVLFIVVAIIATFIPDIDSGFSTLGRKAVFKPMQFFVRHRSFIHSFTFCLLVSIMLAVFIPQVSSAFFLGYSLHLLADSFTKEGITAFWPYKKTSSGFLRTGGRIETSVFLIFAIVDLLLLVLLFV
jgi:inner membrane protein